MSWTAFAAIGLFLTGSASDDPGIFLCRFARIPNDPPVDKPAKKEKLEDLLKQVEDAVEGLESGELGLEESLDKYETGMKALKQCYAILEQAEKKIQILVKEKDGSLSARDFQPESKAPRR